MMAKNKIQVELDHINQTITQLEAQRDREPGGDIETTLAWLQRQQAALLAQLASLPPTVKADVSGSGAVAQGQGSKAAGERSVLVEGNVMGNIITGDQHSSLGGIEASKIRAENVVQGMQQIGGDLSQTAAAAALAEALRHGRITADSIEAKNVVSGFQYIADLTQATPEQLRQEVAHLRQQLAEALAAGEIDTTADIEDAQESLAKAETEMKQEQPQGSRIRRQLRTAAEILTEGAKTADAARKTGLALAKLASVAAALYQLAIKLFGG